MSKADKKKQAKVIEDRTFGLKNKNKSKQVQKYIKGVENTVKNSGKSEAALEAERIENKKAKQRQLQEQALLNALYKDVGRLNDASDDEQDDPKNTVCPYFKQGLCQKGKKCIYSHDLTLDRNEEIDLYVDQRTQLIMNQIGTKNMSDLSEEELSKMLNEKEKLMIKGAKSDLVCKFFLEAVKSKKYGWNWTCANGDGCKYKHCLPPGYVLDPSGKIEVNEEDVNLEEKIDEERNKLLSENRKSPLVTYEIFLEWKKRKEERKIIDADKKKKEEEKKAKNKGGQLRTGKELFNYDPTLFVDDAEAADDYVAEEIPEEAEEEGEDGEKREKLYSDEEGQEKEEERAGAEPEEQTA